MRLWTFGFETDSVGRAWSKTRRFRQPCAAIRMRRKLAGGHHVCSVAVHPRSPQQRLQSDSCAAKFDPYRKLVGLAEVSLRFISESHRLDWITRTKLRGHRCNAPTVAFLLWLATVTPPARSPERSEARSERLSKRDQRPAGAHSGRAPAPWCARQIRTTCVLAKLSRLMIAPSAPPPPQADAEPGSDLRGYTVLLAGARAGTTEASYQCRHARSCESRGSRGPSEEHASKRAGPWWRLTPGSRNSRTLCTRMARLLSTHLCLCSVNGYH